ncbi:MAG: aminotransferase class IV [Planctomycetes bacterium]|nr:aminotransferase class IV [Planctomycetota bacterium]
MSKKDAIEALVTVGRNARLYCCMPVIEGITPVGLMESPASEPLETGEDFMRRHGIFRLNEVGISPLDHDCLYGDGVFEGILIYRGQVFLFREHMERLGRSLEKTSIELPYSLAELTWQVVRTIQAVGFSESQNGYIRLVVTRGMGDLGINPKKCVGSTIYCIVSTIKLYPTEAYERGIQLGLSKTIRRPDQSTIDPTVKSLNYLNNVLALIEGTRGTDLMESLMLNRSGFVAEATVDNIFVIERSNGWEKDPANVRVRTPSDEYCLNGITRATLIELARAKGYRVVIDPHLMPIEMVGPDREVFMTGTGAGVMPITHLHGVKVGDGVPGPVTRDLVKSYMERMADPKYGLGIKATRKQTLDYLGASA